MSLMEFTITFNLFDHPTLNRDLIFNFVNKKFFKYFLIVGDMDYNSLYEILESNNSYRNGVKSKVTKIITNKDDGRKHVIDEYTNTIIKTISPSNFHLDNKELDTIDIWPSLLVRTIESRQIDNGCRFEHKLECVIRFNNSSLGLDYNKFKECLRELFSAKLFNNSPFTLYRYTTNYKMVISLKKYCNEYFNHKFHQIFSPLLIRNKAELADDYLSVTGNDNDDFITTLLIFDLDHEKLMDGYKKHLLKTVKINKGE